MTQKLPDPKMIVLTYLLAGFVGIIVLSGLWFPFRGASGQVLSFELFVAVFFILLTAAVLYFLLRRYSLRIGQALQEVQAGKEQLAVIYGKNPQPIWIVGETRKLLSLNKAAKQLFGSKKSPTQAPLLEILSGLEGNGGGNMASGPTKNMQLGVHKFSSQKDHKLVYLDLTIHKIQYQGQPAWLVAGTDVSALIQTEKDKRQIHNELLHYKKALDRSALLTISDLNGIILDVNNKFCEISKYTREELIGNNHRILKSAYHPASFFLNMYAVIEQGDVWRSEVCNRSKDGQFFWVDMSVIPVLDEHSKIHRYMAISYPITDRKAAELRSEKVHEELMTFMYKASHNLRGPVATISGLLNVAHIEVKEQGALSYLHMLSDRTRHLEYTLNELIDITKVKQEELCFSKICFSKLLKSVLQVFKAEVKKNRILIEQDIKFFEEFSSDEKLIRGLLYYLIDNAIKFRSNIAPCIRISLSEKANGINLSIADNGPGIDEPIRARIFEMYFRGNEKSTGSGLGLYIVNSIVERLSGYISLQSYPGEGTTFSIFLPDAMYIERLKKGNGAILYLPHKGMVAEPKTGTGSLPPVE